MTDERRDAPPARPERVRRVTYCMARDENGVFCHAPIPAERRYCVPCENRLKKEAEKNV